MWFTLIITLLGKSTNLFRYHITQFDILWSRYARRSMIFDQFVEGIELDNPQEEFALCVAQYFEMLHAIRTSVMRIMWMVLFHFLLDDNSIIHTLRIGRNRRGWIRWCVSRRRLRVYSIAAFRHRPVWCVRNTSYIYIYIYNDNEWINIYSKEFIEWLTRDFSFLYNYWV